MNSRARNFLRLLLVCIVLLVVQYLTTIDVPNHLDSLIPPFKNLKSSVVDDGRRMHRLTVDNGPTGRPPGAVDREPADYEDTSTEENKEHEKDIPPFLGIPNSLFRSPYHRYWETNCSALFQNDDAVIKATNVMIKAARVDGKVPMPSDESFFRHTQNCTAFRRTRNYPERPNSKEEEDYPLAYIIATHKEVAQVERLLRVIYQPQNIYCVHPDKKSPPDYQRAIIGLVSCFDNVFIPSEVESVVYAGYTRLKADINCMSDLLEKPVRWRYVMNLCGQDFPLKTNLEIIRQLKAFKGHNDINGIIPPSYIIGRTKHHFIVREDGKLVSTSERKTPAPHNFTIYFGNAYLAATRAYVSYVVNDQRAIDLLEWSKDTWSPDEHYWVTVQRYPGVPGGYPNATWDSLARFIKWGDIHEYPKCIGKNVRAVCVFGVGYLQHLVRLPHLFGNKFHYDFDPVTLQCMEEMLEYRQRYPGSIHQFLSEFPNTTLIWQNHTAYIGD
ncbi:N-acetyllactosaminide beta-1,6-N-acetylglucosaminyl-transferase-like [Apostichopus japonicus]|uniref:N-acetyllactosaminide beta-1,6-N-acetylglucosaminyl-transferase-like n=1 Tax=Stichopus japonicus TaxID=307972 RepID=UPI003AB14FDF